MNMVEIWFSILTTQQVRRGVYHDVTELIAAIEHFIENYNDRAKPFVWNQNRRAHPGQSNPGPESHFRSAALGRRSCLANLARPRSTQDRGPGVTR
jgi:hypothetical protein